MGGKKAKFVWVDEVSDWEFPKHLNAKQPFKNKKTGEIQYISWWELYIDRQREVITKAILYGNHHYEQKLHIDDWEAIPDTIALRLLHGPKKTE